MDRRVFGRITQCSGTLRVAFGGGDFLETSETYRSFADRCIRNPVNRVLLEAGDNDPLAHAKLRDALEAMARAAAIPADFKLALVASTLAVGAVYRDAQRALRAAGVNAWVFASHGEALEWLEGRSPGGRTAS
jgi:hypothetical protein